MAGEPAKVETVRKLVYGPEPAGLSPVKAADRAHRRERAMKLYADLFAAGHHTTLQHANFVFVLDNVSRLAIWSFFHAHPFYNSEQVSQRYREVTGETMVTPDLPPAELEIYQGAIDRALAGYRNLTDLLSPDMAERYGSVFPGRAKAKGPAAEHRFADAVQKRAQEVARYVLPLATPAHLYHTVNGLTLLRYHVLARQPDVPSEVRAIVDRMVAEVLAVDPFFLGAPGYPLDLRLLETEETIEAQALAEWRGAISQPVAETSAAMRDFRRGARAVQQPPRQLTTPMPSRSWRMRCARSWPPRPKQCRTRMRWRRCSTRLATPTWVIPSSSACSRN